MTKQKEFHELMQEMENLLEKHKDFTYYYQDSEDGEYIRKAMGRFFMNKIKCTRCDGNGNVIRKIPPLFRPEKIVCPKCEGEGLMEMTGHEFHSKQMQHELDRDHQDFLRNIDRR